MERSHFKDRVASATRTLVTRVENPFRLECHDSKGGIFTPGLAEARTLDHVTTLLADPGRLLFRLGRNIYEEATLEICTRAEKTFCLPTKLILCTELTNGYEVSHRVGVFF